MIPFLRHWLNCHLRNKHAWSRAKYVAHTDRYDKTCRHCSVVQPVKRRQRARVA